MIVAINYPCDTVHNRD